MSMSTHIIAFVPPDDKFNKMKDIWNSCKELNIKPPEEVYEFFDGSDPDPNGIEIEVPYLEWTDNNARQGVEIKVEDIPQHVQVLRFYNSY